MFIFLNVLISSGLRGICRAADSLLPPEEIELRVPRKLSRASEENGALSLKMQSRCLPAQRLQSRMFLLANLKSFVAQRFS